MISNGTLHYDHDRDGTHTQLAGCEAKFRNYNHDTHLSIIYKDDTLKGKDIYNVFNIGLRYFGIYNVGMGYLRYMSDWDS